MEHSTVLETITCKGYLENIGDVYQNITELVNPELSNQDLLNQLFSLIDLQVKNLKAKLNPSSIYARNEDVIKGAIAEIRIFTTDKRLPCNEDVWGDRADKLMESINHYLDGIKGTNINEGDILENIGIQSEGYAYKIYEAVQPHFTLINGGIAAFAFYAKLGQLPLRDEVAQLMIREYNIAQEKTLNLVRKYLTDFSTVEAKVREIVDEPSYRLDKTTEIFNFLSDKYRPIDHLSLPTVRWLVISCYSELDFNPKDPNQLRYLGNSSDFLFISIEKVILFKKIFIIFPFVDTYTKAVDPNVMESEIEKLNMLIVPVKRHNFKVIDRTAICESKQANFLATNICVPESYRLLVVESKRIERGFPWPWPSFVTGLCDIKVLKSESLPLYHEETGRYEILVF